MGIGWHPITSRDLLSTTFLLFVAPTELDLPNMG